MASPAASSAAELMRLPVDRRSIAAVMLFSLIRKEFAVSMAAELVLITVILVTPLLGD
jgi:hypothetical protein